MGTNGEAPYPFQTAMGIRYQNIPVEIDEQVLREIASTAGGEYFRATSNSKLKEVYEEIDKLEKTKLNVREFSTKEEEYQPFALVALIAVILELALRATILRRIA